MLPKDGTEVVISGVGAKFPESNNIAEFQEKLFAKADLVTVDNRRWRPGANDTPRAMGKILEDNKFDAAFFGIHRRLCISAEPVMKFTLEQCYEAMIDAGVNPFTIRGQNVAVINVIINSESEILMLTHDGLIRDGFGIQGHAQSLTAERASYFFNFLGPSYTLETSTAGGMDALSQAASMIRRGEVSAALVTASYVMWAPSVSTEYAGLGMATFEDHCRPFDAKANGFIRSDGIVTYFLQRKEDANRIYATVANVDSQCLGDRKCSYINFSLELEKYLANFYGSSGYDPSQLSYMEPEGFAIKKTDTLELNSVTALCRCRKDNDPLLIGSVKSNAGYAHTAASFMAVAKALIALETGFIPPTLHYDTPNPDVPALADGRIKVVTEETSLKGDLVAVNSLSFSGGVGHVLLKGQDKQKTQTPSDPSDILPRLMVVSARHESGIKDIVHKLSLMPLDVDFVSLVNNVHRTNIPNHLWRGYVISPKLGDSKNSEIANNDEGRRRPVWFVFSGMGTQWTRMGSDLLKIPVFAAAIEKCDKVLKPLGIDIHHILTTDETTVFDNILNAFVGIAAVQVGLVDILNVVGVRPDGMLGHSAGELGCAYADGCLTAEQMVLAAYARGKVSLDAKLPRGLMAAVGLGYNAIKHRLPASVDVACHNASDSCTISGPADDIDRFVAVLKAEGVFVKAVSTGDIAFHSRAVYPVVTNLKKMLTQIIPQPKPRSDKWLSTSVPREDWKKESARFASAEYYANNLSDSVLFEEASVLIPQDAIVVEIAPHGLMQAILRRSLGFDCINIPLTSRTASSNIMHLLNAFGKLYLNKLDLDVNALFPAVEYPVSRGTPSLAPLVTWDHTDTWFGQFASVLKMLTDEKVELIVEVSLGSVEYPLWKEHCVAGKEVVPVSQLLVYPWKVLLQIDGLEFEKQAIALENVVISETVSINQARQELAVLVLRGSRRFEVSVHGRTLMTGSVKVVTQPDLPLSALHTNGHAPLALDKLQLYALLHRHGHTVGKAFQAVQSVLVNGKDMSAQVCWTGDMVTFVDGLIKLVIFLHLDSNSTLVQPCSFRLLTIDAQHFYKLPTGSVIEARYDSKTNVLYAEGFRLCGLTFLREPIKETEPSSNLIWKSVTFVPYYKTIDKLEEFLSITLQLVAEWGLNSWKNKVARFVTLELRGENSGKHSGVATVLNSVLKTHTNISTKIQVKSINKAIEEVKHDAQNAILAIGDYNSLSQLSAHESGQVFYLLELENNEEIPKNGFQPVLSHNSCCLLTKRRDPVSDWRLFELDWAAGLREFMRRQPPDQTVVVVSRRWRPRQALKTLARETYARQLRCVFVDHDAPKVSLASPEVRRQLSANLAVNVLSSNGEWGSERNLPIERRQSSTHSDALPSMDSSVKSLQISCIGLNARTFTLLPQVPPHLMDVQFVDWCGKQHSGSSERLMGVARCSAPPSHRLAVDPLLAWTVPKEWADDDAATVPVAYSLAYYSVHTRAQLRRGESVLVHAGLSPLGQAIIAVCMASDANIFATVTDRQQVAALAEAFPQLNPLQIINMDEKKFEVETKLMTKGNGVDLIINCLLENETASSLRSAGFGGRMIYLSDIQRKNRESIGLNLFFNNVAVHGVSVDSVVNCKEEEKQALKKLVEDGIRRGVVTPLNKTLFPLNRSQDAINNFRYKNMLEKTVVSRTEEAECHTSFHCSPDETVIVLGTRQSLWVDLARWLVRHGARRLIIASAAKQSLTSSSSRRLNQLMCEQRATLMMTTCARLDTLHGAHELLSEAARMGPVAAVFCTYIEEKSPQMINLEEASREVTPNLRHFVSLLGGSVCRGRHVIAEGPLPLPQALFADLADALATDHPTLVVTDPDYVVKQAGTISMQDVKQWLPCGLRELEALGSGNTATRARALTTLSLPYDHFRVRHQLLPVFVMAGLSPDRLFPLTARLMHPAFSLPHCTAETLAQEVCRVQSQGPVNLVAETWAGRLALQLAIVLEEQGRQVELFLLDAAPDVCRAHASVFALNNQTLDEPKLLTTVLELSRQASKKVTEACGWEARVECALAGTDTSADVVAALSALRETLVASLLPTTPQYQPIAGNVHLVRPNSVSDTDSCGLKQYCKKTPIIHVTEDESHEEMLSNPKTAAVINEHAIFTWDL